MEGQPSTGRCWRHLPATSKVGLCWRCDHLEIVSRYREDGKTYSFNALFISMRSRQQSRIPLRMAILNLVCPINVSLLGSIAHMYLFSEMENGQIPSPRLNIFEVIADPDDRSMEIGMTLFSTNKIKVLAVDKNK